MSDNGDVNDEQSNSPEPGQEPSDVEDTRRFDDDLGDAVQTPAPSSESDQRFAPPPPHQQQVGPSPNQPQGRQPDQHPPRSGDTAPQPYAGYASAYASGPPQTGPSTTGSGPQPYPTGGHGYGASPPVIERRRSRGFWPAVSVLALVLGLVGGAVGGIAIDKWDESREGPGRSSGGLADLDVASEAPLPAENGSVAAVAEKLLPSTVQILSDADGQQGGATGSGFFMDKQGHVVTNNHVIEGAAEDDGKIQVVDRNGERYPATVVGRSPIYDLAVLYVKDPPDVKPAALGSSQKLLVGETVVAIGSPLGLSSTVTSGIVSAKDRPVTTGEDSQSYINAVQTDAAINPGNSGGPLVNLKGEVVGVNSAIATTGGPLGGEAGNIGVGFAIPMEQVRVTADQILKDGEARYPVIGATVESTAQGDGAHIRGIENNSPAEDAGLKEGDVVTGLGDRLVTDSPTLIVAIRAHQPGDKVTLVVQRDGEERKVTIELDSKVG